MTLDQHIDRCKRAVAANSCQHVHYDTVDGELGPFKTVTCSTCGASFDDTSLAPSEVKGWDMAIEVAKNQLMER